MEALRVLVAGARGGCPYAVIGPTGGGCLAGRDGLFRPAVMTSVMHPATPRDGNICAWRAGRAPRLLPPHSLARCAAVLKLCRLVVVIVYGLHEEISVSFRVLPLFELACLSSPVWYRTVTVQSHALDHRARWADVLRRYRHRPC